MTIEMVFDVTIEMVFDVRFFEDHIFMGECISNSWTRCTQSSKTFITNSIPRYSIPVIVIVEWS